ncbi:MAG: hypothetical protein U5N58_00390 [Actinomycetota bacterium]|nr:hypothetical protein [Actinomycetota bacterium]
MLPMEIIKGAIKASSLEDVHIVLVGKEQRVRILPGKPALI